MDYYAEQSLLMKIVIFIVAWNVIGVYNKYIYPSIFRLKIPRFLDAYWAGCLYVTSSAYFYYHCKLQIIFCLLLISSAVYLVF